MAFVSLSSMDKIRAASRGLPPKLKAIAEHITSEPRDIIHLSIVELAKRQRAQRQRFFVFVKGLDLRGIKI